MFIYLEAIVVTACMLLVQP